MVTPAQSVTKRVAVLATTVLVVALAGPPTAARAAAGPIATTAQGLRATITLLGGLAPVTVALPNPGKSWTTGGPADTSNTLGTTVTVPLSTTQLLNVGAVAATAEPVSGGGRAQAGTAGLNVLGAMSADAISTSCLMTAANITTTTNVANLNVAGAPVNPGVDVAAPGTTIRIPQPSAG